MGFILYIASLILQIIFVPAGVIFGLCKSFYDTHFINGLKQANHKFLKMAIGTDIFGNVYGEELLNATLIKPEGLHRFGEFGITISEVLGYNLVQGTLTKTGKVIVAILNTIQKDHCLKAIGKK